MVKYPLHLLKLIDVLKKLPGVGTKSAERFAFEMIQWPNERLSLMAQVIEATSVNLRHCTECGCLSGPEECEYCRQAAYRSKSMCVVAMARDVFAIESTREYEGLYHVLGALLSPIDGIGPENLNLDKLKHRIRQYGVDEVVIAIDSTLQGDATSLYLKQELEPLNVHVSRLAFGLPMGSSLDFVDGGTLARALSARASF